MRSICQVLFNLLTIMFRIFILIDEKYVNDSLPFNNFLVKVSWIIKQIICFNQRRVKAVLDAFFKNSNATAEDMYVQMASIVYIFQPSICLRLTATHGLKFSALESENIRATVLLTLSFHGWKRLRHSIRAFIWNLSGCWRFSSVTCR